MNKRTLNNEVDALLEQAKSFHDGSLFNDLSTIQDPEKKENAMKEILEKIVLDAKKIIRRVFEILSQHNKMVSTYNLESVLGAVFNDTQRNFSCIQEGVLLSWADGLPMKIRQEIRK